MIKLRYEYGGEQDPDNHIEGDRDDAWGIEMCMLLSKAMGDLKRAGFYDAAGKLLYEIEKTATGVYTFQNMKEGRVYIISEQGEPFDFEHEDQSKEQMQVKLKNEILTLEYLERREVL